MDGSNAALEARIAELEAENASLRASRATSAPGVASEVPGKSRRKGRGRSVLSAVVIVVALVLTPVAVLTSWARWQLVDTDRFVSTFAPLAEEPAVQAYLTDEVTAAIEAQVDIPALTADLFDGLRALDLPPRAEDALGLLEAPATQGLQSLVAQVVERVISSDAFADTWANALRVTHRQAIAAIQGQPDAALEIGAGGQLSIQLGPIIAEVKQRLIENGVGFAQAIPEIDRSVVIAESNAFTLVQTIYALAVAVGLWLPWIVVALLVTGVLIARHRANAVVWTAGGFALVMALMAAGVGVGHLFFVATVSPSIMPLDAADVLYDQIIDFLRSTIVAALVLGILAAVIAWWAGPSRPARSLRGFSTAGFAAIRGQGENYGVTTGSFGVWLDRWRTALYAAIAIVATLVVLLIRPITTGRVVATVLIAILAIVLVELLRRPPAEEVVEAEAEAKQAAADEEAVVSAER
ncbi:hypothetical protein [Agromyces agglutinans]|uniref:hypothetical protein n=1 Tax=Agromyces agglutinans TaxID=2662258 RepID=UPI001C129C80|nr:hypothetical protein [Agromyces agglutinans]